MPNATSVTGPSKIVMRVSGDSYQGSPLFNVAVDGKIVATRLKAEGNHDAMQWVDVVVEGDFTSNPERIDIRFVNDLWDGTRSTDRNIYVDYVEINGRRFQGEHATSNTANPNITSELSSAVMLRNGTLTFVTSDRGHIYVSLNGDDDNLGTADSPFRTIQKAADAARPGMIVHVAPGTYDEHVRTSVNGTADAPIRFISDILGGATIMPTGATGEIWMNSGDYVTIEGFEIDGSNSPGARSGIEAHGNHVRVISNHVHHILLDGARDSRGGAGITLNGGFFGDIEQHVIGNLVHDVGGTTSDHRVHGIYHQSSGSIVNNIVYSTPSAITLWHDAREVLIANNTVFGNDDGIGIGAGDWYLTPTPASGVNVINNIVYDNLGTGISEDGWTGNDNRYDNNLVYDNGLDWDLQNGLTHRGTVSQDPQFLDYRRDGGGRYALQSTSPAIDAGTGWDAPSYDIDGAQRPIGASHDVGAYEWRPLQAGQSFGFFEL